MDHKAYQISVVYQNQGNTKWLPVTGIVNLQSFHNTRREYTSQNDNNYN